MLDETSVSFADVIEAWLAKAQPVALREKVASLQAAYEKGASSAAIDLAAYLTVRAPATYAALREVLRQACAVVPGFAPQRLLDLGCGPGTASFAAATQFPSLRQGQLVEADARFASLAQELSAHLPFETSLLRQSLLGALPQADLVLAGYVMAELPLEQMPALARHLWRATTGLLVVVEPGTPQGFARIRALRETLLAEGAEIIGPCTQARACPVKGSDWCHFKTRLSRSRSHIHAKGGVVPFEDEAFSWLAVARFAPGGLPEARVVAPPAGNKVALHLRLCGRAGLQDVAIATRDKATYKRARKLSWGDGFTAGGQGEA